MGVCDGLLAGFGLSLRQGWGCVHVCAGGGGGQGKHRALLGGYCSNSVVWDQSDRLEKVSSGQFWTR